jgi:hypothetical protein
MAWVIYSAMSRIVKLGGIFLGPTTNNVVEYGVVIELPSESIPLNI